MFEDYTKGIKYTSVKEEKQNKTKNKPKPSQKRPDDLLPAGRTYLRLH